MANESKLEHMVKVFTKPMTQKQLAAAAGLSIATVCRHLKELMSEPREVHISAWLPFPGEGGGTPVAVYTYGAGTDVECTLHPLSNAERCRRYHTKKAEENGRTLRPRPGRPTSVPRRDVITTALFGPAP